MNTKLTTPQRLEAGGNVITTERIRLSVVVSFFTDYIIFYRIITSETITMKRKYVLNTKLYGTTARNERELKENKIKFTT